MNYSTSFLDLCSCALGGLLLLMFLLVPQSKPKAFDIGGVKPSLMIDCHYPVYTSDFDKINNYSLPFSVKSIRKVVIALSNGQKMEFYNKDRSKPLWECVVPSQSVPTDQSPQSIVQELDDGSVWTLTFEYRQGNDSNAGEVSVCANIELQDEDISELQAIMMVQLAKELNYNKFVDNIIINNLEYTPNSTCKKIEGYVNNDEFYLNTHTQKSLKGNFYSDASIYLSDLSDASNKKNDLDKNINSSFSFFDVPTSLRYGYYTIQFLNVSALISDSSLKNQYIDFYNGSLEFDNKNGHDNKLDIFSNITISYVKLKANSNDKLEIIDQYFYMPNRDPNLCK